MSTLRKTLVIAEAGVNHNGDLQLAKKLVLAASDAGADIIKFQTFQASKLATESAKQVIYQQQALDNSEGQLAMLKRYELKIDDYSELIDFCEENKIEFLSSAFDMSSIGLLCSLKPKLWKVPSVKSLTFLIYVKSVVRVSL